MLRIQRRVALLLMLSLIVLGCEAEEPPPQWTTTTDTFPTGTVHVVHVPPPSGGSPGFEIREELWIGSIDGSGPESFGDLKGLVVTADGHIVVLDALAQELRVFAPDGTHTATFGGKGGGPGEFESAYGLMLGPAGKLWVPDHSNARMSAFDLTGDLLGSYPMRILSYGYVWGGTIDGEGQILEPSITLGPPRRPILRVYDSEMSMVDSLPLPERPKVDRKNPPGAFYWEAPDGRTSGYRSVPFYPRGQQVLDPNGSVWTTMASGDPSYRIVNWIPGGDSTLQLETRRPAVPIPTTVRDSVIATVREELLKVGTGAADQDWSKVPEVYPAVSSMFLADNGDLWAEIATTGDSPARYDVYRPNGDYWGTVSTTLEVWPYVHPVVRGDHFWAIVRDDLDIPYVVRGQIAPVEPDAG